MAFPTSSTLDALTRGFESPLGNVTWSSPTQGTDDFMILPDATGASAHASGVLASSYWSAASFGPDCEVWVKFPTVITDSFVTGIMARIINPGASVTAYKLFVALSAGVTTWTLAYLVSGTQTQITTATQTVSATHGIGLECIGTAIKCYHFNGTSWNQTPIISVTDSNVTAAGRLGIRCNDTSTRIAPFGGGTIEASGIALDHAGIVPQLFRTTRRL